jgi:hypothetical protein
MYLKKYNENPVQPMERLSGKMFISFGAVNCDWHNMLAKRHLLKEKTDNACAKKVEGSGQAGGGA